MGGFGAIHFGAELGITCVAFSPQASLEEEFGITDNWKKVAEYAKYHFGHFNSNITNGKCKNSKIYMFYDSKNPLDKNHAAYIIKNCKNCISFNIPKAGHACTNKINKYYRIKKIVMEILDGSFDPYQFRRKFFSEYEFYNFKAMNGIEKFPYLKNIIKDVEFDLSLKKLNADSYKKLCILLLHLIEKKWPQKIDDIITYICNTDELKKIVLKDKVHRSILENEYDRIMTCGLYYYNRKKYHHAEKLYRKLLFSHQHDKNASIMLAKCLHKQGDNDNAISIIDTLIVKKGKEPDILNCLGAIFFSQKKFFEAKKYFFQSFIARESLNSAIYYAKSLKECKQINRAIYFLRTYEDRFSSSGDFLAHLGAYLVMAGHYNEGTSFLCKAKLNKKHPSWVESWIRKATQRSN